MRRQHFTASRTCRRLAATLIALVLPVSATGLSTIESQPYLLIGQSINDAVLISNFEIGANQAPTPMSGLTLVEPFPPSGTLPVGMGITNDGNVAVVDPLGQFNFSDLDIYADPSIGVQCAGSAGDCNNGDSNTTFNGSPFPANGLTGNVDFTDLMAELANAQLEINALASTGTIDLTGTGGKISGGTTTIMLDPGLNVIDIVTGTDDFLIENANFIVQGGADSSVIFRVDDDANTNITQSALLVGDGGIGLDDVLFYSDKNDNNTHFDLSNVVLNGIAFWDLSMFTDPSEINFNNVQGCTQVVGNKLNTGQNVRLTNCGFAPVPEPNTALLVLAGLTAMALGGRSLRA